jgi:hypothetical protein
MPIDVYPVNLVVGDKGKPGAPLLHVAALVNVPSGLISGHAEITQAIAPPEGLIRINDIQGRIRSLGFGTAFRVVTLDGTYIVSFPPPAIGEMVVQFSAILVVGQADWTGRGSFTYGTHDVEDVPVTPVPLAVAA